MVKQFGKKLNNSNIELGGILMDNKNVELLRQVFKNGNNITKEEERSLMINAKSKEEKDFYQLVFNFFLKERAKKVINENK